LIKYKVFAMSRLSIAGVEKVNEVIKNSGRN